jgi:hypothetical protein
LLVSFGDDGLFPFGWGKFGNFGKAAMDGNWACGFCCGEEYIPCIFTEAADEECFGFFRVVLEDSWA